MDLLARFYDIEIGNFIDNINKDIKKSNLRNLMVLLTDLFYLMIQFIIILSNQRQKKM